MSELSEVAELLPARMINEFVYCRRLFHLMHVEKLWADNVYTEEGKKAHRRVDRAIDGVLDAPPDAGKAGDGESGDTDAERPQIARSVTLGSERLGVIAKLDLVATEGDEAVPVETKRGRVPDNEERSWPPERIQLMIQGLLLREHGYSCTRGVLYFAGSRTRVDVPFTPDLEAQALRAVAEARQATSRRTPPPPLEHSKKCIACSLAPICLPDETNALRIVPPAPTAPDVRRLYPPRTHAQPLYVQEQGAVVGKQGETLVVRKHGEVLARVRLKEIDQLVLCGNVQVSTQTVHLLCEAGIPVVHVSSGHWFYGITQGFTLRNAFEKAAQFEVAGDRERCLEFARAFVTAKGLNQRTMLRRNGGAEVRGAVREMRRVLDRVEAAASLDELLGIEGQLAGLYFESFGRMLRPPAGGLAFEFENRNRRPPRDPVNAMLSFGYAMLVKECAVALASVGLDPFWGLYHQPRHGRPGLALDLMEEFRPVVVDSAVITAVNTGMVRPRDFVTAASGCAMKDTGRKRFIAAFASRLDQLVTHPIFEYRCSWRQMIRLQARLLGRCLRGEFRPYRGLVTR